MLITFEDYQRVRLAEGCPVMTVGYLYGYAGQQNNQPIVLLGNINLVSHEQWFLSKRGRYDEREAAFIAQLDVTGGASGSPVMLDPHSVKHRNGTFENWTGGPTVVGVVKACVDELQGGGRGLAAIEPGERVFELANAVAHHLIANGVPTRPLRA